MSSLPRTELAKAPDTAMQVSVAVLIPCLNEAAAIGRVVADFRASLGDRAIWADYVQLAS